MNPKYRIGDLVQLTMEAAEHAQIDIHHLWKVITINLAAEEFYYGCSSYRYQHAAWLESELTKPYHPFVDGYNASNSSK